MNTSRQKNPSFAISVLRKRTKPTTGKCCFSLRCGFSLSLLVGKRKKNKLISIFPHIFLLLKLTWCPGFLAREGSVRGSAGAASEAVHFEAAARAEDYQANLKYETVSISPGTRMLKESAQPLGRDLLLLAPSLPRWVLAPPSLRLPTGSCGMGLPELTQCREPRGTPFLRSFPATFASVPSP